MQKRTKKQQKQCDVFQNMFLGQIAPKTAYDHQRLTATQSQNRATFPSAPFALNANIPQFLFCRGGCRFSPEFVVALIRMGI